MTRYEFKVVPAPERGVKAKGVKTAEGRFALALEEVMNRLAQDGWDYVRAETLPSEERQGLSGRTTVFRNLLVFRRQVEQEIEAFEPRLLDPPKEIPVLDAARAPAADRGDGAAPRDTADTAKPDANAPPLGEAPDDNGEDTAKA